MTLISSDSLNPMLVRDLRQGLRSSRFTLVFLALHTGMAFFVVLGLLSGTGSDVARMLIQTLEMGLILFYILGLPMAATFALSSEFLDNRIDLLKLTHLSARSLVWGKWLSLVTQGLMVFASLLPYLILTYFFGSVDVPSVLESVVSLLAFSALLVAACVALSCFNNMIFRIVLILGLLGLTMTILDSMNGQSNNQPLAHLLASIHADPGIAASLYLVAGAPFLWLVMEFGAYFLSPTAENHDTPQRLILFGLIAIAGLTMVFDLGYRGSFVDTFLDRYFFLAGLLALWVLMFAAATNPSPYPDTYRPFMRFGLFGQFMGRVFLYPGWPSSAPFILLATAFFSLLAATWISLRGVSVDYSWFAAVFWLLPPALLFPQVAGWLVLGRLRIGPCARYFAIIALVLLVFLIAIAWSSSNVTGASHPNILLFACVFPPDAWLLFTFHWLDAPALSDAVPPDPVQQAAILQAASLHATALIISGLTSGITMIVVCVRGFQAWAHFSKLERRATSARPPKRPPAPPAPVVGGPRPGPTFRPQNPS